jgi:hypothetical protein
MKRVVFHNGRANGSSWIKHGGSDVPCRYCTWAIKDNERKAPGTREMRSSQSIDVRSLKSLQACEMV